MKARPISDFLWIMIGPAIWAAHLFLLYAAETLICISASPSQRIMLVTTATLTGGALCALAAAAYANRPRAKTLAAAFGERNFEPFLSMTLAGMSAIAVIWTALPALALRVCTF